MGVKFSEKAQRELADIFARHETKRSALLPVLFLAQREFGYVSGDVVELVAEVCEITPQEVWEVSTFYTMYNKQKVGRYHIQVCGNLSCYLRGGFNLIAYLEEKLGINVGETTADGMFTLSKVECLGSCGTAPVVQVNETFHESMTPQKLDALIDELRRDGAHGATSSKEE